MKVLVIIDAQNDFITGSLANKTADERVPNIVEEINSLSKNDFIFMTKDTHFNDYLTNTLEGKKLPVPHCIMDTEGWKIDKRILKAVEESNIKNQTLYKESFGYLNWNDQINTLFSNGYKVNEIEVVGFCTDICVISNVLAIKAAFPNTKITVKESCCAGVTPESHQNALKAMEMCHIDII